MRALRAGVLMCPGPVWLFHLYTVLMRHVSVRLCDTVCAFVFVCFGLAAQGRNGGRFVKHVHNHLVIMENERLAAALKNKENAVGEKALRKPS
jgi:hypothetical protein